MAVLGRLAGNVLAIDGDPAPGREGGIEEAANIGEQRRLARAGGAHDGQHIAGSHAMRDRDQRAVGEIDCHAVEIKTFLHLPTSPSSHPHRAAVPE
ncbi:MAG: hypothetical protein H6893_06750 [Brucellaceae bacterium]|nr:hypothetical protein [Brucellaceae bacterium]